MHVLVTLNKRAAKRVKTGASSQTEMVVLLHDRAKAGADLELKQLELPTDVMVTVVEAYMGDSAFAQVDLQFLFEVPQSILARIGTRIGTGVEEIAKEHFARSAIPTNVMLVSWWAIPTQTFRYESTDN